MLLVGLTVPVQAAKVVYSDTSTKLTYLIDTETKKAQIQGFTTTPKGTLTLPSEVVYEEETYTVEGVMESAFQGCARVTSLKAGSTIKYIGKAAFKSCGMLRSATLDGVEEIGEGAFVKCAMLATLTINSPGLRVIGSEAFGECVKLTGDFNIPATVAAIGDNPWYGCTGLTAINAPEGSTAYKTAEGILYNYSGTRLISYPCGLTDSLFVVPAGVKTLGISSLRGAKFTGITIPEGVENLDSLCLYGSKLQAIAIPASVNFIGVKAITGSFDISNLTVSSANTNYIVSDGYLMTKDGHRILYSLKRSGALSVPEGVERIDDYTFMNMTGITSVTLPSTLRTLGEIAFYQCSGITELNLGNGLMSIGRMCFQGCTALTALSLPASMRVLGKQAFCNDTKLANVTLNEGLERIDDSAFLGCTAITKIHFPGTLKNMGAAICYQNTSLTEASLGEGITTVPDQLFNYDVKLSKVTLPNGIRTIERAAFYSNPISEQTFTFPAELDSIGFTSFFKTAFVNLVLPDKLRVIGDWAFASGTALKSVRTGRGTKVISLLAFNNNPELTDIKLNEGLDSIGDQAFTNLPALDSIVIPSTVRAYGKEPFSLNTNLKKIIVNNPVPAVLTQELVGADEYAAITLMVPAGTVEAYKAAEIWKKFGTIEVNNNSVTGIDNDDSEARIVETYTIDGRRVSSDAKGMLLQRLSNGKVRKVMVK